MADPFVAEIRIFPFNFAPTGWAFCNGQLLPISQNTALFSLLGTFYGGNGQSTFALPDMQGNAPMHPGQGPGLSLRDLGEVSGSETVTLLTSEIPIHKHNMVSINDIGDINVPTANGLARSAGASVYTTAASPVVLMAPNALAPAGGDLPHNNRQPYLTLNFCIALQGVYPPRS
ncbi:MAG: tail fiber protein [Saprospiraceae bacterium]